MFFFTISTGAGFLPSTVCSAFWLQFRSQASRSGNKGSATMQKILMIEEITGPLKNHFMINDNNKKKKDDDNVNSVYHVSHVFMILDVLGITCLPDVRPWTLLANTWWQHVPGNRWIGWCIFNQPPSLRLVPSHSIHVLRKATTGHCKLHVSDLRFSTPDISHEWRATFA